MTKTPEAPAVTDATPGEVLDREYLAMRAGVLDLAAALDRVERAGEPGGDARWSKLRSAMEALLAAGPGRAERVQLLFSLPYDEDWRDRFDLADASSSVG